MVLRWIIRFYFANLFLLTFFLYFQILYDDLNKVIQTATNIPPMFQELQFRGEILPVVERPIQDIKFGEEIVVVSCYFIFRNYCLLLGCIILFWWSLRFLIGYM